jgi:hypothetical protein
MALAFATETYSEFIREGGALFRLHWEELSTYKDIPLNVDHDFYSKAEQIGMLKIYTVRVDGHLIGYAFFLVRAAHPHYQEHSWAVNDIAWVHPDHRREGIAEPFIAFWEQELAALNVDVVHMRVKVFSPALGYMLVRCGYSRVEIGYEKRLT